jgi:AraC-like DNA-binding protein
VDQVTGGGDYYGERPPPEVVPGLFRCVWSRRSTDPSRVVRVVPDGCTDVIWHRESGKLFVAGPDTRAQVAPTAGTLVGVRFAPGAAPAGIGVPADELRDRRIALEDIWQPSAVRRLGDLLAGAATEAQVQRVLTGAVLDRVEDGPDPLMSAVLGMAGQTARVTAIAREVGLSERQLHRRCLTAFGYGPKVLHRILRFDRAVRTAWAGVPFADIAYQAGYADQAHLSREVRALAGVPLGTLLAA